MKDAPLSIYLIPNSDRIVIEKQLVESLNGGKKVSKEDIKEMNSLPIVSRYYECIFGLKDMYLFRGVAQCNLGKYQEAIQDFIAYEVCASESSLQQTLFTLNSDLQQDINFAKAEAQYNILVCYLLLGENKKAE